MIDIEELKFDEKGLIPAIVVDAVSKKVLTLAYMNRESLRLSLEKELTCFWSRSRQKLWLKGETSGNWQHIVSVTADCDKDALLVLVEKDGHRNLRKIKKLDATTIMLQSYGREYDAENVQLNEITCVGRAVKVEFEV